MKRVELNMGNVSIGKVFKSGKVQTKVVINKSHTPLYNVRIKRNIINRILSGECISGVLRERETTIVGARVHYITYKFIPD